MAQYTRAITNTLYDAVDTGSLAAELQDAGLTAKLTQVSVSGTDIVIDTNSDLTAGEITTMDATIAAHTGIPLAGTLRTGGGLIVEPLEEPGAPTVAAQGTTGSTTWGYKVSAFSDTGETLVSSETQITDGNATLGTTNFNRVTWTSVVGAVKYAVYRSTAGGTPATTGKLLETALLQLDDTGLTASGSEPSENLSGALVVGTGTVSSAKVVTIKELTSDVSTVTSLLRLARRSSGTVQAGFGTGIYCALDDAGGTLRDAGSAHFRWDDPAAATLHSKFRIQVRDGGTGADKDFEVNHDGEVTFDGATLIKQETCSVCWSPGEPVTGGNAGESSNNGVQSVTFDDLGESRIRWNTKPPKNYISGDLTLRLHCAMVGTPGSNTMRIGLNWQTLATGEAPPSSWPNNIERTESLSSVVSREFFNVDFTLGSATFDKNDNVLAFYCYRNGDHADDDTTLTLHIHLIELLYMGWSFGGQAGQ